MLILLLQVVFVLLKLDCIVDWPWMVIFSPALAVLASFVVFGPPFSMRFYDVDPEDGPEE